MGKIRSNGFTKTGSTKVDFVEKGRYVGKGVLSQYLEISNNVRIPKDFIVLSMEENTLDVK